MYLFIYRGYKGNKGPSSRELLLKALNEFQEKEGLTITKSPKVEQREKGKPFFNGLNLEFSISHSDNLWGCLMAYKTGKQDQDKSLDQMQDLGEVGMDIQTCKDVDYKSLSNRYFTPNETFYIENGGIDAFYELWTSKEALAKMKGNSIFTELGGMPLVKDGTLQEAIDNFKIKQLDIFQDAKCAICYHKIREYGKEVFTDDVTLKRRNDNAKKKEGIWLIEMN